MRTKRTRVVSNYGEHVKGKRSKVAQGKVGIADERRDRVKEERGLEGNRMENNLQ